MFSLAPLAPPLIFRTPLPPAYELLLLLLLPSLLPNKCDGYPALMSATCSLYPLLFRHSQTSLSSSHGWVNIFLTGGHRVETAPMGPFQQNTLLLQHAALELSAAVFQCPRNCTRIAAAGRGLRHVH